MNFCWVEWATAIGMENISALPSTVIQKATTALSQAGCSYLIFLVFIVIIEVSSSLLVVASSLFDRLVFVMPISSFHKRMMNWFKVLDQFAVHHVLALLWKLPNCHSSLSKSTSLTLILTLQYTVLPYNVFHLSISYLLFSPL